jgi:predicted metalloendopeptidase
MGKVKKSFKKFSQTQLKQTIERRRATQKIVKDRKKREVKKLNRALLDKAKPKQQGINNIASINKIYALTVE